MPSATRPEVGKLLPTRVPRRLTVPGAVAISAVLALFLAFWSVNKVSLAPPKLEPRHMQIGAAATHVLLDANTSLVVDQDLRTTNLQGLVSRATLYGDLLATPTLRGMIGKRIGVPPDQIASVSRLTAGIQREMREPDSEQRANQIRMEQQPYRLDIQADPGGPIISIYAQAPSPARAMDLANAAVASLKDFLKAKARATGGSPKQQVIVTQLGRARGGVVNRKTVPEIVALTFLVSFALSLTLLLGGALVRRGWLAAGRPAPAPTADASTAAGHDPGGPRRGASTLAAAPSPSGMRRRAARSPRETMRSLVNAGGDWPRTTRVLPWMIAGFMVVLWLVPFNVIQLTASLPFDLKFDRLVLPIVFGTWILSLAAGGPAAPRLRLTWSTSAVGPSSPPLPQHRAQRARAQPDARVRVPVKRFVLLLSYALFFLIVASSVRRTEVPAFMKYTLVLVDPARSAPSGSTASTTTSSTTSRTGSCPASSRSGSVDSYEVDDIGRLMIRGPAEHPLETVGDALDGLADRARGHHPQQGAPRPRALRPGGLHPARGGDLHVSQERAAGADLRGR